MSDNLLIIVLRLIHLIAGVFWAGTVMAIAWFLLPAAQAIGQPGAAFMQQLMFRQRLRPFVLGAMLLTILSGLGMYGWMAMETDGSWASSKTAMVLGIGAIAAIIAGGIGSGVTGRLGKRTMALSSAIQASGGPPTKAQKVEMETLQRKIRTSFRVVALLVLIAVIAMATARYV